jgi:para-nitrobenzyl esterase
MNPNSIGFGFMRSIITCGLFLACVCAIACGDDDDADANSGDAAADRGSDAEEGEADDALLIQLDDGEIQGEMSGEARRFLKIPYAKPPLGELRFKAPVPNDPWTVVRHETEFAQSCAQLEDQGAPPSNNEDCLYLNVWAPEPPTEGAPVMMWIHGGGNFSGGAGIPIPASEVLGGTEQLWYDGQYFAARNGVVLVTINYRLGPFGFFAHPDLADEGEPLGNQGLLDQRMALQWIKKNIAKFGGDPDNVTIFGESAGAGDVCYHVASPGSRGLFHRAVSQSGGCTIRGTDDLTDMAAVGEQMEAYGEAVGCEKGQGQLDCLRQASVEDLLANANQPSPGSGEITSERSWSFGVVMGGSDAFLPNTPRAMFDSGDVAVVPFLIGTNNDEANSFFWRSTPLTSEEEYMADLEARYGDAASDIAAVYPPSDFDGDFNAARLRLFTDAAVCRSNDLAIRSVRAGMPVYMYNFNVWWSVLPEVMRAAHGAEMSHVFGNPFVPTGQDPTVTEESQAVADAMNTYWSRFAENGNPNWPDAPAVWPEFDEDNDLRLQLDSDWEVLEDYRAEQCAFWFEYYGVE